MRRVLIGLFGVFWSGGALGRCVLNNDEDIDSLKGALCSVNQFSLYGFYENGQPSHNQGGAVVDTDTAYYLFPKVSWHYKGYLKGYVDKESDLPKTDKDFVRSTDQNYLHLGHALEDTLQLSLGRLPLPFGLHHEILRYQMPQRTERFWDRSVSNGGIITWRARTDFTLDLGGTSKSEDTSLDKKQVDSFTVRATQHLDMLSGAKLIGSYQNHGDGKVGKMGAAALVFRDSDASSLEWIRIAENWRTQQYQQLFRFVYQAATGPKHWNFEYDDLRDDSSRLALSYSYVYPNELSLGGGLQWERLRFDHGRDNFVLLFNLSYAVTVQTNLLSKL